MTGGPVPLLMRLVRLVERTVSSHRDRYEPALHYMRGPGPKCRERARGEHG